MHAVGERTFDRRRCICDLPRAKSPWPVSATTIRGTVSNLDAIRPLQAVGDFVRSNEVELEGRAGVRCRGFLGSSTVGYYLFRNSVIPRYLPTCSAGESSAGRSTARGVTGAGGE